MYIEHINTISSLPTIRLFPSILPPILPHLGVVKKMEIKKKKHNPSNKRQSRLMVQLENEKHCYLYIFFLFYDKILATTRKMEINKKL